MSRTMRNKLFSMIDFQDRTYKSFEEILAKGKNGGQKQKLTGLLEDAQESAIHIGNTVESLYGEGTDTVSELEDYCETLYQMSLAIDDPGMQTELLNRMKRHLC